MSDVQTINFGSALNLNTISQFENTNALQALRLGFTTLNATLTQLSNTFVNAIHMLNLSIDWLNYTVRTKGANPKAKAAAKKSFFSVGEDFDETYADMLKPIPPTTGGGKGGGGKGGSKEETFNQLIAGLKPIFTPHMAGIGGGAINQAKGLAAPFVSAFATLGPQMAAMAIVTQPLMEFFNGLLEPFSILGEYFGAFGSILGQIFVPILMQLQPIFDAFIPILQSLAKPIGDILLALFNMSSIGILIQLINPLMPLIAKIIELVMSFVGILTPFLGIFTQIVGLLMNTLIPVVTWIIDVCLTPIINFFKMVGDTFTNLLNTGGGVIDFFERVGNFFANIGNWSWTW